VGFFSSLGSYDAAGTNLVSGAQTVDLVPIPASALNQDAAIAAAQIDTIDTSTPINPAGGVIICFESGGTDQYGIITVGGGGRQLTTKLEIVAKATEAPGGRCRL